MLRINLNIYGNVAYLEDATWDSTEECPITSDKLELVIRDIEDELFNTSKSKPQTIKNIQIRKK